MGKAVPKRIRRAINDLLEKFGDMFKPDFEHNKKVLKEIGLNVSKRTRNIIAGRITRIKRYESGG